MSVSAMKMVRISYRREVNQGRIQVRKKSASDNNVWKKLPKFVIINSGIQQILTNVETNPVTPNLYDNLCHKTVF